MFQHMERTKGNMKTQKQVILITGTPGVGKTSVARLLVSRINALYINLTKLAVKENLITEFDKERGSYIVNEAKVRKKVANMIKTADKPIIIDGHYAVFVAPKELVTHVFVLRRDPVELKALLEQRGFSGQKLWENLAAEILDTCLMDALNIMAESAKICEINICGKNVSKVVDEILAILKGEKNCSFGIVDWLGKLEQEGVLEDYLKI